MSRARLLAVLILVAAAFTVWSAWRPKGYDIWLFEIAPGLIGAAVFIATYRRFPFSNLVYVVAAVHFVILAVAAKYTYADMPWFNWLRDSLGLSRNHYDRVGHFMQGFGPALIVREVLLRTTPLMPGKMVAFLCVCVCLAFSAFWEMIEWWFVLLFYPDSGPNWLGMQGDVWDAQWDMFMALCGAVVSMLLLSRLHDRSMAQLGLSMVKTGPDRRST